MREEKVSQHYVPRLHLRNFRSEQGGNSVYSFDKQNLRIFNTDVSNVAAEDFFYDGKTELVPEIENFLEKIEYKASMPYKKIVQEQHLRCLNSKEKGFLAYFIALQSIRTRGERSSMKGMIQAVEETVSREKMSEDFREEINEMKQERSLREVQNDLMRDSTRDFAKMLLNLEWHLLVNNTDLPYYTSDHPVVKHNDFDSGPYGNFGLMSPGIQIYFPLTPELSLYIIDPDMPVDVPEVWHKSNHDTVIFQRDLQVSRSNRFVYSNTDNFDQAERKIKSYPEMAEPLSERGSDTSFDT